MSRSEPDATRIVRLWLEEGVTALPDHVLDAVIDQLPDTSQRRPSWLARRTPTMNKIVTIGLAAAAVVVAAFIGYQFLFGTNVGGPPPALSPSPSAEPSVTPSASSPSPTGPVSFTTFEGGSALPPGDYVIDYAAPVALVTFTVPDEPFGSDPSPFFKGGFNWGPWHQNNAGRLGVAEIDNLYADPCDPVAGPRDPAVGPAVDDLVAALTDVPGLVASSPVGAELSGYAARYLEITGDRPADCVEEPVVWLTTRGDPSLLMPHAGDLHRVWVVDVEGQRLVIWASEDAGFDQTPHLEALVDSLVIEAP
jgi:hypothetical protein